jgi:protein-disulfide isomerase
MNLALWSFVLALQLAPVAAAPKPKPAAAPVRAAVPVDVVVFSDFQCPFCAQFSGPFRTLQQKGVPGAKVRVQFKHFPLTAIHPAAPLAHQAALAAKAQGKFWEMHDLLFANQARAQRADLLGYAKALKLDLVRFERDMDSDAVKKEIAGDLAEGVKLGVAGTPTFLINGKDYAGTRSLADLTALVNAEVHKADAPLATRRATTPTAPAAAAPAATGSDDPMSVDLVLYSDFQCPFCQQFAQPFRELQTKGIDGVKTTVQFKNFPLSIHPNAQVAHQAAMAAKAQGKFWEMHDLLFANQQRAQKDDLLGYAKKLGLDVARFQKDMDSEQTRKAIAADVAEGAALGVNGTPSYTINGKLYSGTRPFAQLKELIVGDRLRLRALAEVPDTVMSRGPSDAPVVLELFADLQSPVTKPTVAVVNELLQRYPDRVRLQFRNFPLAFHPQAAVAHEAAMTAGREGHFWEFVTYELDHQDTLREQDLIALAGRLGIDPTTFAQTLDAHRYAPRVEADVQAGQQRGIRGSPVVLVNGKRIDGVPSLQTLTEYVEAALAAKPVSQAGTP